MTTDLTPYAWPLDRLGEAIEAAAHRSGMPCAPVQMPRPPGLPADAAGRDDALGSWVETATGCLGLEAEAVETSYAEIELLVRGAGPAVLCLPDAGAGRPPSFLVLQGRRGGKVSLIGPDQRRVRLPLAGVVSALRHPLQAPLIEEIDQLLITAGVPPRRRGRARTAIFEERLGEERIGNCWMVRLPRGVSFWRQLLHARLPRRLVAFFAAHTATYLIMVLSWWVVGNAALQGRFDRQWLIAWVLLLITQVPLGVIVSWAQGTFAIGVGGLLKLRLLQGALRLEPDEIRHEGAGQLLGRVIESGAVESMALSAGFSGIVAAVELIAAGVVLSIGPGGALRLVAFGAWIAITAVIGWRYYRQRRTWTTTRMEMTNDLVERMVGHRTRLAQQRPERWHDGEDQLLARYMKQSTRLDTTSIRFSVFLSRGWMVAGLAGLIPVIIASGEPVVVAVALGGVMLAARALGSLANSLGSLTGAAVAWRQVAPLFHAAARRDAGGSPEVALTAGHQRQDLIEGQPLMEASDLVFRYRQQGSPVIRGCDLTIHGGDRLLLEGPSGGGKTTLANLLVGLRQPESGLLLLRGLDRQTLGIEGWRRQVVAAPQFHENHVMTGTFAFNLLMGRRWPPRPEDLQQAEDICLELGLGPLLQRMPSGLQQVVGETGWRLSHGEQSRLFMARALLQRSELIVLDESFAALDPGSLRQSLECVLRRAPTLLVIAHP